MNGSGNQLRMYMAVSGKIFHNSPDRIAGGFGVILTRRQGQNLPHRILLSEDTFREAFRNNHVAGSVQYVFRIAHQQLYIEYLEKGAVAFKGLVQGNKLIIELQNPAPHG